MRRKDVVKFFGGVTATARALEITRGAIYQWKPSQVPERIAHRVEMLSLGKLRFEPSDYPPKNKQNVGGSERRTDMG